MAKELVLIPRAEYEKLIGESGTQISGRKINHSIRDQTEIPGSVITNTSDISTHKNASEPATTLNRGISKENPLLSKSFIWTTDQDNSEQKDFNAASKTSKVLKKSTNSLNRNVSSMTAGRGKSNSERIMLDQSGGRRKGKKYVRQTFSEFLEDKRRQKWIPYKI